MGNPDFLEEIKPSRLIRQKRRDKRLHEELIECGRYQGGKKNKKNREAGSKKNRQQLGAVGNLPQRESIRQLRKTGIHTSSSDNLEPLRRWLQAQVGRKWSDVYSELSSIIQPQTMHGVHIKQHLFWEVQVYPSDRYGLMRFSSDSRLFVDPETGVLRDPIRERVAKSNLGTFPKKARFKKEKERNRSRIRQKIPTAPTEPIDFRAFPNIRTRGKNLSVGALYDVWETEVGNFQIRIVAFQRIAPITRRNSWTVVWRFPEPKLQIRGVVVTSPPTRYVIGQEVTFMAIAAEPSSSNWKLFDAGRGGVQ